MKPLMSWRTFRSDAEWWLDLNRSSCVPVCRAARFPSSTRTSSTRAGRNAYNQPVVTTFSRIRSGLRSARIRPWTTPVGFCLALAFFFTVCAYAQTAAEINPSAGDRGRIVLVLPFDNRTGQPRLDWIREASAEFLRSRLASAGFYPMSRADRVYALGPPGAAAGLSSLARQLAQAGRDAGRRFDRRGQLRDRRQRVIVAEAQVGGRAPPAHDCEPVSVHAVRCATFSRSSTRWPGS
jgi:TolB-like protein